MARPSATKNAITKTRNNERPKEMGHVKSVRKECRTVGAAHGAYPWSKRSGQGRPLTPRVRSVRGSEHASYFPNALSKAARFWIDLAQIRSVWHDRPARVRIARRRGRERSD